MYLYENHLGGLYTSDEIEDEEFLYCEECGDSDQYIGKIDEDTPIEDAYKLINDYCGVSLCEDACSGQCNKCPLFEYSGGYARGYIMDFLTNWYQKEEIEKFFNNLVEEKISEGKETDHGEEQNT